jgi:hypothetical protein
MKRFLLLGLVLALMSGAAWASYSLGYQRGFDRALVLQNGTFVAPSTLCKSSDLAMSMVALGE